MRLSVGQPPIWPPRAPTAVARLTTRPAESDLAGPNHRWHTTHILLPRLAPTSPPPVDMQEPPPRVALELEPDDVVVR